VLVLEDIALVVDLELVLEYKEPLAGDTVLLLEEKVLLVEPTRVLVGEVLLPMKGLAPLGVKDLVLRLGEAILLLVLIRFSCELTEELLDDEEDERILVVDNGTGAVVVVELLN
jgi:hypothetical protein